MPTIKVHDINMYYEMHAGINGSQMVTFEGGHIFFFMRERQRFLDEVVAFLSG